MAVVLGIAVMRRFIDIDQMKDGLNVYLRESVPLAFLAYILIGTDRQSLLFP